MGWMDREGIEPSGARVESLHPTPVPARLHRSLGEPDGWAPQGQRRATWYANYRAGELLVEAAPAHRHPRTKTALRAVESACAVIATLAGRAAVHRIFCRQVGQQ